MVASLHGGGRACKAHRFEVELNLLVSRGMANPVNSKRSK